jgi:hypothetical protein
MGAKVPWKGVKEPSKWKAVKVKVSPVRREAIQSWGLGIR